MPAGQQCGNSTAHRTGCLLARRSMAHSALDVTTEEQLWTTEHSHSTNCGTCQTWGQHVSVTCSPVMDQIGWPSVSNQLACFKNFLNCRYCCWSCRLLDTGGCSGTAVLAQLFWSSYPAHAPPEGESPSRDQTWSYQSSEAHAQLCAVLASLAGKPAYMCRQPESRSHKGQGLGKTIHHAMSSSAL